ncbi:MAG TPA: hypothetical protein VJR92_11275 [Gemmatimonadaceae bacterium]|nr:hypothetical protein [Gemmatimonadaceae bacterium]
MFTRRSRLVVVVALIAVAFAGACRAGAPVAQPASPQTASPTAPTPTPVTDSATPVDTTPSPGVLLARHEQALGGRDALDKHSSLRMTGTVEIDGSLKGTVEILRGKPNKLVHKLNLQSVGELWKGYDGATAWVLEMSTPALLTDVDAAAVRNQAQWDHDFLSPVALFVGRVDTAEFEGEATWKVTFASELGLEVQSFFSRATGLRTGVVTNSLTGPATTLYADYTEAGGVRVPMRLVTRTDSSEVVIRFDKVEWDKVLDKDLEMPPPVKAIAKD